jgi:hypothetical protein
MTKFRLPNGEQGNFAAQTVRFSITQAQCLQYMARWHLVRKNQDLAGHTWTANFEQATSQERENLDEEADMYASWVLRHYEIDALSTPV